MDVRHINPFIESIQTVMPQIGFCEVKQGNLSAKNQEIFCSGVIMIVGIVGMIKGNVVYCMSHEDAKKIAATMMMEPSIDELDEMAKSALSELSNMLTANAATIFSDNGISIDISTPTLLYGENVSVTMSSSQVLCIQVFSDEIPIEVNISFEG